MSTAGARALGLGLVSEALEANLRRRVQRHGIVIWLDRDRHYIPFVAQLAELRTRGVLGYDVYSFRGSHLELLLALENVAAGTDKPRVVVHLPGFNEVRGTPLYELCLAGKQYHKALPTVVREAAAGQVRPEEAAAFLAAHAKADEPLTLERADRWLRSMLAGDEDEQVRKLRGQTLTEIVDELLGGGELATRASWTSLRDALWTRLEAASGMTASWREESSAPGSTLSGEDIAHAVASWALCVEYVDDLRRDPVAECLGAMKALPRKVIDDCCALARHLREQQPSFYSRTAGETELRLPAEVEAAQAEDLGQIDTFRFEDDAILQAALAALGEQRFQLAHDWAVQRIEGRSFWLRETPSRRSSWELVRDAAQLGLAMEAAGTELKAGTLAASITRYQQVGSAVDRAHRQLEQQRAALLFAQLPDFEQLRTQLDALRALWRGWADGWARGFNAVCKTEGFLPAAELQQRQVFEQVVLPLCQQPGVTALFLIDALRYELAEELQAALAETPATTVHLEARLAELPTVTAVGMSALVPVADGGRLQPVMAGKNPSHQKIRGFSTAEFQVHDPETRRKAASHRVGGATCPSFSLAEVLARDAKSLKQGIARAKLLIVQSTEIDDAGEKGVGPDVFPQKLLRLRTAWRLLREAGVRRFVITADHGFLLAAGVPSQPHGNKRTPDRRHVLSTVAADHRDEVRVPLAELRYQGVDGQHLMFPAGIAVFDRGNRDVSFVHGGNSLQERVIPVLTALHRSDAGSTAHCYKIDAQAKEGVAGMHCIGATIESAEQTMMFGGLKQLELRLDVLEGESTGEGVYVELCQLRGAKLERGAIVAEVGRSFEVFFRLLGHTDDRVRLELVHSGAQARVTGGEVAERFAVAIDIRGPSGGGRAGLAGQRGQGGSGGQAGARGGDSAWLDAYDDGGVRSVMEHLAAHGTITETEVAKMLGSQRAARKFAMGFEIYAAKAPFVIHIDFAGALKRYVREGSAA